MSKKLIKSGMIVSGMTLASRVMGLVRDVVIANLLGAGVAADVFFFANRIPNFLRRLFAEGAFNQAFVPVMTEYKKNGDEQAVRELLAAVARGESVLITLRLAAAELFALPWELLALSGSGLQLGALPGVLLRYAWPQTQTSPPSDAVRNQEGGRVLFAWSAAGGAVPAAEHEAALRRACQLGPLPIEEVLQVLPQAAEQGDVPGFTRDAVGDLASRTAGGVLHKYEGRALLIATGSCAVHCRYCFRRHFPYAEETAAANRWREAIEHLRGDASIHVILGRAQIGRAHV